MAVEPYIEPVGLPVLVLAGLVVWGAFRGACSAVRILLDRWRNR
jgi:hypothetical protein